MGDSVATVADAETVERVRQRALRFLAQRHAARLLYWGRKNLGEENYSDRLTYCGRMAGKGERPLSVMGSDHGGGTVAHMAGVARCAAVWSCPVCADAIGRRRGAELGAAFSAAQAAGYSLSMDTRTVRHGPHHSLEHLVGVLTRAARRWRARKPVMRWMQAHGVIGVARCLEVTHGGSGWHPHLHSVLVSSVPVDSVPDEVRQAWVDCVRKEGGDATVYAGYDIAGSADAKVGQYVAKLGTADLSYELADPAGAKRTKGDTPAALLRRSMEGDKRAGRLWLEAVAALRGKAQIFISKGLRNLIGELTPDEEAAEETLPEDDVLLLLTGYELALVAGRKELRARLLEAVEAGNGRAYLDALKASEDDWLADRLSPKTRGTGSR